VVWEDGGREPASYPIAPFAEITKRQFYAALVAPAHQYDMF